MLLHDDPALDDLAAPRAPALRPRNAYLAELEAESIFILREIAAECRKRKWQLADFKVAE